MDYPWDDSHSAGGSGPGGGAGAGCLWRPPQCPWHSGVTAFSTTLRTGSGRHGPTACFSEVGEPGSAPRVTTLHGTYSFHHFSRPASLKAIFVLCLNYLSLYIYMLLGLKS